MSRSELQANKQPARYKQKLPVIMHKKKITNAQQLCNNISILVSTSDTKTSKHNSTAAE